MGVHVAQTEHWAEHKQHCTFSSRYPHGLVVPFIEDGVVPASACASACQQVGAGIYAWRGESRRPCIWLVVIPCRRTRGRLLLSLRSPRETNDVGQVAVWSAEVGTCLDCARCPPTTEACALRKSDMAFWPDGMERHGLNDFECVCAASALIHTGPECAATFDFLSMRASPSLLCSLAVSWSALGVGGARPLWLL